LIQVIWLPSTWMSLIGVVVPWPDCVPVSWPPTYSRLSTVAIGPVGLFTVTFHWPSMLTGCVVAGAGVSAAGCAGRGRTPGRVWIGRVSQPRTVEVGERWARLMSTSQYGKRLRISSSATRPSSRASTAPRQVCTP